MGYLCFTANEAGSTITLTKIGSPSWTGSYSTDGSTWITYVPELHNNGQGPWTNTITLNNVGDKVYFKGNVTADFDNGRNLIYVMTGSIAASGNIMSLCSGDNYENVTTIPYSHCFYSLFAYNSALTTAPELPATTLKEACYCYMFAICTSLTTLPLLPANILKPNCYQYMFTTCTSLKVYRTSGTGHATPFVIPPSGEGFPASYALDGMFYNTGGDNIGTPAINTTYYIDDPVVLNVNKVVYNNETLIDLTSDTVDASHLAQGYTAHDCSGASITGTYVTPETYDGSVS